MSRGKNAVKPIILVKTVDQFTAVFATTPKPLALWRAFPALAENSIFSYSYDLNQLTTFTNNIRHNGLLQPVASASSAYVVLFCGVMWDSSVWKGNVDGSAWKQGMDSGPLIFAYHGLKDSSNLYYLGWIKIDGADSDGYQMQLPSELQGVLCIQDGPYVEFFSQSLDFCRKLESTGFYTRVRKYSFYNSNMSIKTKLNCAPCPVCCGVHRDDKPCPFLSSPSIGLDAVKQFYATPGDVIVREDLASRVVEFVSNEHFLLIQAPPCTGKTTLLRNIGLVLLNKWPRISLHYAEGQKVGEILPLMTHHTPPLRSPQDVMNYLSSSSRTKGALWLIIDECQFTYTNRRWWDILYRPPYYDPNLFVVAAGSFGSHSDSQSHSPPIDVPLTKRMPLFPSAVPNPDLFLAFTKAHLEAFLRGKNSVIEENIIVEYASPVSKDTPLQFGVHPGVVANLVRFLGTHASKFPFKNKAELMDAFRANSEILYNCPHPLDIERCLPRPLPSGFSPIWMLMFSTVLWHGYVEVPHVARGIPEIVVENSFGPMKADYTSPTFCGVLNLNHLLKPPTTNQDFALIAPSLRPSVKLPKKNKKTKHTPNTLSVLPPMPERLVEVREFVRESYIARTPRERFELYPSNTSHSGDRYKPYSARQMVHASLALTDFQQAAHDARQLGWLLELPASDPKRCKLVLPSQWHYDYLQKSLTPKVMKLPETTTLDEFILLVLRGFNGPYLLEYLSNQGTIRERVYEMEFYRCAHRLAGAGFLTPQSRTADGSGYADFVVRSRQWVIEVASEGDRLKDHMERISDTGSYTKEWPTHEKRVVDFRVKIGGPKEIKDSNYIVVKVNPPSEKDKGPLRQHLQMTMRTTDGGTLIAL